MIALHSFFENPDFTGRLLQPGDVFTPDRVRGSQLAANGLAKYSDTIEGASVDDPAAVQVILDQTVAQMNANNDAVTTAIARNKRK